jgi:regulator of protease activity HflC (stomatin/prohibitin superfamily)
VLGTVIGRTASLFILGLGVIWLLVWLLLAYISKQRSTLLVLAIFSVIWAIVGFWRALAGDIISMAVLFVILLITLPAMLRVVNQYQRAILLRFGKLQSVLEPGLNVILPWGIDRTIFVDMRTATIDVPKQDIITHDNVPVSVDAVIYFNVFDPKLAVLEVQDYRQATTLLGMTMLRSILGSHELDDMLSQREKLNEVLKIDLDKATDPWGVRVSGVEIKAVDLPEDMKRAMAKQAEAERERRAKIIAAEGEYQASEKLAQAADVIGKSRVGVLLRMLQTLSEIAVEKNSTIVFPLPMEILSYFQQKGEKNDEAGS